MAGPQKKDREVLFYCLTKTAQTKTPLITERRFCEFGAGNETRTRDPDLGKVVLYQLSYSRNGVP
ncbi:conserved hypothetical protein [Pseudomonas sp. IT-P2]